MSGASVLHPTASGKIDSFATTRTIRTFLLVLGAFLLLGHAHAQESQTPPDQSRVASSRQTDRPQAIVDLGPAPSYTEMRRIQLVLRRSDDKQHTLQELLALQLNASSKEFHHWLTPAQFGQKFGPTDTELGVLENWLTIHGFSSIKVNQGRTVVEFSGSVASVQSAFQMSIHKYSYKGKTFYSDLSEAAVPGELATLAKGIVSLSNIPREDQERVPLLRFDSKTKKVSALSDSSVPMNSGVKPSFTYGSNGSTYFAVTPFDFAAIYNVTPLWSAASPIDGTGHTIAIVGDTSINAADFVAFRQLFGLPLGNTSNQNGTQFLNTIYNGPPPPVGSDEAHANGDTQWAAAVAKGAVIDYVASESTEASRGIDLSASYIVDNNLADIVVDSYATCELQLGSSGNAFYQSIWEQASAQGMTVVAAAGDSGVSACDVTPQLPASHGKMVSGIASTPFNVAVGGSDFYTPDGISQYVSATNTSTYASAVGYIPEAVWNDTCTNPEILSEAPYSGLTAEQVCNSAAAASSGLVTVVGGGGGPSSCTSSDGSTPASCSHGYAKPSWQAGLGVPADSVRDLPDVSLFAAKGRTNTFYFVCQQDQDPSGVACDANSPYSDFRGLGGTEIAAPAFGGIMAMVVQSNGGRLGNPNYVLYYLAQQQVANKTQCSATGNPASSCVFHDIVMGTNAMPCAAGSPGCTVTTPSDTVGVLSAPPANTGYDLSSGLGSVDAANLVKSWSSITKPASTAILSINPATIVHGNPVTTTVMVTGDSPTGEVSINAKASYGAVGSGQLTDGSYVGTFRNFPGGTYGVQAYYAGDANNATATSNFVSLTVTPEPSTTSLSALTYNVHTGATAPATTVPYGTYLILRTTVAGDSGQGVPTGTIELLNNAKGVYGGFFSLNSSASVEVDDSSLPTGSDVLAAKYSGDPSFNPSNTSNVPLTVTQAPTTSTVSGFPSSVSQGGTLTLYAAVNTTSLGSAAPMGTITFLAGAQVIGVSVPTAGTAITGFREGLASLTVSGGTIPLGINSITVSYSGDVNYLPSVSAPVSLTVTSSTLSATSVTASVSPTSVISGTNPLNFFAAVSAGKNLPGGTVQFAVDGQNVGGPVVLSSAGMASLQTTSSQFSVGSHALVAIYSGDQKTYSASTSQKVAFTVTSPLSSTVNYTVNPTTVTQGVYLPIPVTVVPSGPVATGTVRIQLDGFLYGNPVVLKNGAATLPLATGTIQVGTHILNVEYSGDGNYPEAYGFGTTLVIQAAGSLLSQVTVTNLPQYVLVGDSLSFTAAVTPVTPAPTGIYQISLDGENPTAPVLLQGLSQTLSIPASSLPIGTHSFTVFYSGDSVHSSATSSLQTFEVTPPGNFSLTVTPDTVTSSRLGGGSSIKVTVTPVGILPAPVTFSCSGLPAYTACQFSPSSLTVPSQSPMTDTLTFLLDTGVVASDRRSASLPLSGALASIATMALLLPMLRRRRLAACLFTACTLALLSGLTGCGSGYRAGVSPAGTFNIVVAATSSGITRTATVTLKLE